MAFTPQAKAEKLLKELQKLPANKRCADCSGNGSLVRFAFCPGLGQRPAGRAAGADALRAAPAPPQAPQYVCMNFGTFICTNCATAQCVSLMAPTLGAPRLAPRSRAPPPRRSRALNHRVKGISMSVFSQEEVAKLQAAGNEVLRRHPQATAPRGRPLTRAATQVARARYMPAFTAKLPDAECVPCSLRAAPQRRRCRL